MEKEHQNNGGDDRRKRRTGRGAGASNKADSSAGSGQTFLVDTARSIGSTIGRVETILRGGGKVVKTSSSQEQRPSSKGKSRPSKSARGAKGGATKKTTGRKGRATKRAPAKSARSRPRS